MKPLLILIKNTKINGIRYIRIIAFIENFTSNNNTYIMHPNYKTKYQ